MSAFGGKADIEFARLELAVAHVRRGQNQLL